MSAARQVVLAAGADLDSFRAAVRHLIAAGVPPAEVLWSSGAPGLLGTAERIEPAPDAPPLALPRGVAEVIDLVVCHREPERFALLYQLVWRVLQGERALLAIASDPLVHRLHLLAKAVRRDLHKMHAFLRFRVVHDPDGSERFVAWFEPDHDIVRATAGFFVNRFRNMVWSILTPFGALHWDTRRLEVGPPGRRSDLPEGDGFEAGWRTYYQSVFNPARVNPVAMRSEMPRKYWANMPETQAIPELIRSAPARVREMIEREAAMPTKRNPDRAVAAMAEQAPHSLEALNRLIAATPPFVPGGTRAVLGEGPLRPDLAFVGEQPGDQEDLQGRPFVGPAGQLLDRALAEAGIDRARTYVTNAVKHFKFEQQGKRRLHKTPTAGEVKHYRWWLEQELDFVQPRLVVALGATAVLALAGRPIPVTANRGPTTFANRPGFITVHPSYLLRLPDEAAKAEAWRAFVADLARARADAAAGPRAA
ncbi:UdgX family uracil-DNA binding protein [Zavarzinia sp. CC-PAN008]|uniref:UdgX family uracil-DNA binding protein n=1 Tax=Zavarzinia sp. CC-PAN008 TaxID=3243332 RepID=UPI003F74A26B